MNNLADSIKQLVAKNKVHEALKTIATNRDF